MKIALPLKYALGLVLSCLFSGQALACYTVYNRANQVIYKALAAPVDMRYQLHETLPAVFPDGHLVFSITDTACPPVNSLRTGDANRAVNSLMQRNAYATEMSMARSSVVPPPPPQR